MPLLNTSIVEALKAREGPSTVNIFVASPKTSRLAGGEENLLERPLVLNGARDIYRSRGGKADEQGECEEEGDETGCHAESQ